MNGTILPWVAIWAWIVILIAGIKWLDSRIEAIERRPFHELPEEIRP